MGKSRDSSVGIALMIGIIGFDFRWGLGNFLFTTASEAHPASYPIGIRGSFPGRKAAGA